MIKYVQIFFFISVICSVNVFTQVKDTTTGLSEIIIIEPDNGYHFKLISRDGKEYFPQEQNLGYGPTLSRFYVPANTKLKIYFTNTYQNSFSGFETKYTKLQIVEGFEDKICIVNAYDIFYFTYNIDNSIIFLYDTFSIEIYDANQDSNIFRIAMNKIITIKKREYYAKKTL